METQLHITKFSRSVKRKLLILLFFCILISPAKALVNTYNFSNASPQTLDPMTAGTITTLIAANIDDGASAVTSIGFNFVLNATTYTQFSVNSNGLLRLGATVVTANAGGTTNANSLIANADFPKIAAYWDNLRTTVTTGNVRSKVNGVSPNRILVVDWNCTIVTAGTAAHFQVWLYETSNNIRFIYGAIGANSTGYTTGIAASTTANDMASVTVAATFASSTNSYTTANNTNTLAIAANSGIIYSVPPACAGSLVPAASATGISLTPTLSWTVGTGATSGYDVYFGTAASPPRVSYNQAGTTYLPGTLTAGTIYFWKVVARNDSAQAASCSTIQFTTAVSPGCAGSLSPAASATNIALTPTLSWVAGSGTTTGYDVYFGTAASPPIVSTNQAGTTYTPAALVANTVYFWKIVPQNNGALATGCATIQFTTVVAPGCAGSLSPAASATNVSMTPTLSWAAGSGTTTGYDVYFGTAASPPIVSTNQAGTTYTPAALLANTVYFWKIVPQNNGALATGCTTIQFTTVVAPGCATSLSPAASATNVSPSATLSWAAGSGTTTGYDVYFGTAAAPPLVSTNQAGTTYNPGALTQGTVYFWKVVPRNGGALATCSVIQFTVATAPGCVTGISPAASAINVAPSATLSWSAGSGTTTGYDVYFGTAASPPLVSTNQAGTTYNPGALSIGTVYFWKIVPQNNGALTSGCSTNQFTTVIAPGCAATISPLASAVNVSPSAILSWTAGSGTTNGYDVYFGTAASPPIVSTNQVGLTYNPGALTYGTVYFWKVVPRNGAALATGCAVNQFTVAAAPGCAGSLFPAASATNISTTPTLTWAAGSGTTTGYDVYFGTAASPPLVSANQAGTSYTPAALTIGTVYFWKIVPQNNGALASGCSTIQFTTVVAPGCAGSLFPAASATGISPFVILSWAAGTGTTTGYDVYFGTAASPPIVSTNQAGTTFTPGTLTNGTVYFWKIVPRNGAALATGCSTIQFTTAVAPGCAASLSPAASAINVSMTPTLSWVAGSGTTTAYDVYFGTAASPPLVSANQVGTTYLPGSLSAGTVYFWKVIPKNNGAAPASCTTIQFTTLVAPGCATNLSPAALATNISISSILSWSVGSGTTNGYDVYFGTAVNPPIVSTNQAGTTFNPGVLSVATDYYWKVVPRNGTALATGCAINQFTTIAPPGCVVNNYPDDSATDIFTNDILTWDPGTGITTGYNVYFGTSSNPPQVSTNQAGATYNPGILNIATTYFWKVVPQNGSLLSVGCPVTQFTTVVAPSCITSISPSAAATNVALDSFLSWAPGTGTTTGYDVYFGTASTPPLVSTDQAGTTYTPAGLLNSGTIYYWKIVPRNGTALATGCIVNQFTTAFPPGCAVSLSPAASSTNITITPTLTWSPGSGTSTAYDVYFGTTASPPLVSADQIGTVYIPPTLTVGTVYYWKVIPKNLGAANNSCAVIQFTTVVPPGCAATIFPLASATNVTPNVVLSWTAGAGITNGYDVYFGTVSTPPIISTNQAGTTYTPPAPLNPGTIYYWKVVPRNGPALATGCSTNQFTTAVAPGCPGSLFPAASATNVATSVILSWAAGTGTTTGYDVYFGSAASPPLVSTNQSGTTYNPGTISASTTYFWKVVPQNVGSYNTGCSINQFSTIMGTSCATSISPAHLSTNLPLQNTLSWAAGPGNAPTGYDIYFGTASNPPLVVTNQPGTTYSPGILNWNTNYYWKAVPRTGAVIATGCQVNQFTTRSPLAFEVTRSTGISYNSISGTGTSVTALSWRNGTNTDDNLSSPIPIGFNFVYNGTTYSSFLVSTNGFITFNSATAVIGNNASPYGYDNSVLSSGTAPTSPLMLAPFYDDMVCQGNSGLISGLNNGIKYLMSGAAGNHVLTVEWIGMETFNNGGPNLNFQVKLYENNNAVDFVYGDMEGFNGTFNQSYSYSVGLNGTTISTTPQSGEVFNQLTADSRNFGSASSSQLIIIPECHTLLHFTPGNYTPFVPVSLVPSNDALASAVHLNVNPGPCVSLCGTYYTSANATSSGIAACAGNPDDDVWFEFTAVNPNTTIKVLGAGNYDATVELFNSSMVSLACANTTTSPPGLLGLSEIINMSTLTIGQQYFIRVYHKGTGWGGSNSSGQFSICVSGTPIPPSNDECINNIHLPISSTLVPGTFSYAATASPGIPSCSLSGVNADDDVWYSFTAMKAIEVVTVAGGNGYNAVIQMFSGSCGSLTSLGCANNFGNGQIETLTVSGLTIGNNYYVRVFHAGIGGGSGSYSISISSPVPPCVSLMLPPDSTIDMHTMGFDLLWQGVTGADNYKVYLDTVNPPLHLLGVTTDTTINTGVMKASTTYYWMILPGNGASFHASCQVGYFITEDRPYALNVKVFLQDLYIGGGLMQSALNPGDTIADNIQVNLYDFTNEDLYFDSAQLKTNGMAKAFFPIQAIQNDYYIVITHRNSLETWSKFFSFNTPDTSYDFTVSDTMAYGNNEVQLSPGVYGIYYGDINQDGFVDSLDLDIVGASAAGFQTGNYLNEDINLDHMVESVDFSMMENQAALMLQKQIPPVGP